MKSLIKPVAFLIAVILCGVAIAANINTKPNTATGSSLILMLKNSTDGNYFYSELIPTVSSLRTMSELQSDTPEQYSIIGADVTGPLNETTFQGLNGYVAPNLQAYLAGNTGDVITWTIMASKSGPNANNGQAALVVTSNNDFLDTAPWINQDAWQSATLFENFLNNEFNNATFTNGVSSTNGWGSSNAEGSNAPNSFNGGGYENGAALGTAQYVYLLGTTGGDAANVYKSVSQLNLASTGELQYSAVPVPGAVWLLGSGLMGLMGIGRRRKTTAVAAK